MTRKTQNKQKRKKVKFDVFALWFVRHARI
jgi:hypothetical protein